MVTLEILDVLNLSIALATIQGNSSAVVAPALNSLNDFFAQVVAAIPRIIAAGIILLIGYIIGRGVGWFIAKVLEKMNVEHTINNTGIGQAVSRSGWSFSRIVSTAARWFIYIFFITAAVSTLQFTQLSEALQSIWLWIPNLIAFIIIIIVGSIIADFVGNWAQKELPARGVPGGTAIGLGAKGILYAIVFVTAITQLQIGAGILNTVITALVWGMAGAIAIGLGVGLAFGLKDLLPSLILGTTNVQSILKPGQKVNLNGRIGTIKQAGAFHIILQDEEGKTLVVPTKQIADKEIQIESGPEPEIPEKKVEEAVKKIDKEISEKNNERTLPTDDSKRKK
jgi:mechanosensitive ion channel-like protein